MDQPCVKIQDQFQPEMMSVPEPLIPAAPSTTKKRYVLGRSGGRVEPLRISTMPELCQAFDLAANERRSYGAFSNKSDSHEWTQTSNTIPETMNHSQEWIAPSCEKSSTAGSQDDVKSHMHLTKATPVKSFQGHNMFARTPVNLDKENIFTPRKMPESSTGTSAPSRCPLSSIPVDSASCLDTNDGVSVSQCLDHASNDHFQSKSSDTLEKSSTGSHVKKPHTGHDNDGFRTPQCKLLASHDHGSFRPRLYGVSSSKLLPRASNIPLHPAVVAGQQAKFKQHRGQCPAVKESSISRRLADTTPIKVPLGHGLECSGEGCSENQPLALLLSANDPSLSSCPQYLKTGALSGANVNVFQSPIVNKSAIASAGHNIPQTDGFLASQPPNQMTTLKNALTSTLLPFSHQKNSHLDEPKKGLHCDRQTANEVNLSPPQPTKFSVQESKVEGFSHGALCAREPSTRLPGSPASQLCTGIKSPDPIRDVIMSAAKTVENSMPMQPPVVINQLETSASSTWLPYPHLKTADVVNEDEPKQGFHCKRQTSVQDNISPRKPSRFSSQESKVEGSTQDALCPQEPSPSLPVNPPGQSHVRIKQPHATRDAVISVAKTVENSMPVQPPVTGKQPETSVSSTWLPYPRLKTTDKVNQDEPKQGLHCKRQTSIDDNISPPKPTRFSSQESKVEGSTQDAICPREQSHNLPFNPASQSCVGAKAPDPARDAGVLVDKPSENVSLLQTASLTDKRQAMGEQKIGNSGLRQIAVNGNIYTILSLLGRGGSSKVFQVLDLATAELKAVKCVNLAETDQSIYEGYLNEIKLLADLQDGDCVIRMFDHEHQKENQMLFVVMEKGDTDLSRLIKDLSKSKQISAAMIVYYWTEMLNAVRFIHGRGTIHSDLKPANFLLVSGRLKLIDFGIASSVQEDMTSIVKDCMTGTYNYISPEALSSASPDSQHFKISYKSDVWSLGCILYSLIYGRTPFQHVIGQFQKMQAIVNQNHKIPFPDPPIESCPAALMKALKMCLVRNPRERASVDELLLLPYLEYVSPERGILNRVASLAASVGIVHESEENQYATVVRAIQRLFMENERQLPFLVGRR